MRLAIVGAGKLGWTLAQAVQPRNSVVLIEKNRQLADTLRPLLGGSLIAGDACDPQVLEEAGLAHCDAVIVLTGHDEDNLVISTLAKYEFRIKKVIARVSNPENEWLYNRSWGIDVALNTADIVTSLIEEEASLGDIVTLLKLRGGEVSIMELTVPERKDIVGRRLMDLGLPHECLVAAILRGNDIIVPKGDVPLQPGDNLLVIAHPSVEVSLRQRFQA